MQVVSIKPIRDEQGTWLAVSAYWRMEQIRRLRCNEHNPIIPYQPKVNGQGTVTKKRRHCKHTTQGEKRGMAVTLTTAARNAACNAIVDLIDAGAGAGTLVCAI